MKKIISMIADRMSDAFVAAGYEASFAAVTVSNRPDLCQYQCNGAMAAAKQYKKAPIQIAGEVVSHISDDGMFAKCEAVAPGFINISVSAHFLMQYVLEMKDCEKFGLETAEKPQKIVVDYGGANVAKPLHVGHLRPAVIGEAVKRILRYAGHDVIGDAHLGDWGTPIGLIITELKRRKPELVYFDPDYEGEYPEEAPFTVAELEEIYPFASGYSKEEGHEEYKEASRKAILELQNGRRGYLALWKHIMTVSMTDLKKNYENLNIHFELWKKESDSQPYIPAMIQEMKDKGYTRISEGALVVDGEFAFSFTQGGFLCHRCFHLDQYIIRLTPTQLKLIRMFYTLPIEQVGKLELKPQTKSFIKKIVTTIYEEQTGIRLKSRSFIEQLERSSELMQKKIG